MKKIVRITESDITRLVKKIVNEQERIDDPSDKYFMEIDYIANYAMDEAMEPEDVEAAIDEISDIMHEADSDEDLSDDELDEIISYAGQVIMELENMFDSESPMYEQSSKNISCLLNSGYKKETIGGPMTKREVYTSKKNGMTYQISINGGVRVFDNKTNKEGKWSCENGKVKIMGLKNASSMPM